MTTTISTFRRSSSSAAEVHVVASVRGDGDFHRERVPLDVLDERRRALVDLPWTQLGQCHGTEVVVVDAPGAADARSGDIAITTAGDAVLGCWAADCAPIVLIGADSEFAVVHAGWRGLAAGIVDRAVAAFGEPVERAVLGPAIGACCYEFGTAELASVADGVHAAAADITAGPGVRLDVPAAVAAALANHGIGLERIGGCTGCTYDGFSHRVRRDPERHVVAAWQTHVVSDCIRPGTR